MLAKADTSELSIFATALVVTAGTIFVATLMHGTSAHGLLDGLLLQHLGFGTLFFRPPPLTMLAIPFAVLSLVLAVMSVRHAGWPAIVARLVAVGTLVAVSCQQILETVVPLTNGMLNRGHTGLLVSFAPLAAWVVLLPYVNWHDRPARLQSAMEFTPRLLLCLTAVLQPLASYPIPGSQISIGSFPLLLVCIVAVADLAFIPRWSVNGQFVWRYLCAGPLLALSLVTIAHRDVITWRHRESLTPLGLPGATHLCLPAKDVQFYRSLAATLRLNADTFVFKQNNHNSLYFWSGLKPPTALNATTWPFMLRANQQQRIADALSTYQRVWIISEPFNWPLPQSDAPLSNYIAEHFEPVAEHGRLELLQRKRLGVDQPDRGQLTNDV